ncbi:MAG: acyltransferase family protein [Flaviflexus sp.]|uniref:acyltransferase family protein n=1 Tax=Flaviflexus sp. TaxID=1969482 RepID=UPI003F90F5A6
MADPGGIIGGLDGLRALAVIAVVVYHITPGALPGGFLGVDVFFVVSGFLITTLLLREVRKTKKVDLKGFWTRRARRLLPALIFLVVTVVPAAALINRDLLVGIGRQVLGALTFSSNWLEIAHGSSYFDQTSPLLFKNFWSLAVEEQFYLLWPPLFILIIMMIRTWQTRVGLALGLAGVSALLMAIMADPMNLTRVYYGTDTHLFGLTLGIALAFSWAPPSGTWMAGTWQRYSQIVGIAGFVGLMTLLFVLKDQSIIAYRGGILLASICTVALIAAMLAPGSRLAKISDNRVSRWVGTRSYAIYLWHWPILVMASLLWPAAPGTTEFWIRSALAVAVTFGICEFSYHYIETPIRKNGFKETISIAVNHIATRSPAAVGLTVAGAIMVAGTGIAVASAPEKSSVQLEIEENEKRFEEQNNTAPDPSGDPAGPEDANGGEGSENVNNPDAPGTDSPGSDNPERSENPDASQSPDGTDNPDGSEDPDGSENPGESEGSEDPDNGNGGQTPEGDWTMPTGDEITAIGDSLIVTSADGLEVQFPGINFIAKSNRQWHQAPALVEQGLADGTIRRAVILDFGTNAGIPDPDVVRQTIELLGPDRMIVIVTIYGLSTFIDASNDYIREIASEYPNVAVADWHAAVSAQPQMLQADQTHPNIEGMYLFAETVDGALRSFVE